MGYLEHTEESLSVFQGCMDEVPNGDVSLHLLELGGDVGRRLVLFGGGRGERGGRMDGVICRW